MTHEERFWLDVLGVLEFVSRGADHVSTRPFPDVQARRALGYLHDHPELALNIPPVRLCCGQRHAGPVCPDGHLMCCICFKRVPTDQVWVDNTGQAWDMCQPCGEEEHNG